ncbi:T9SS type A sorting domain-containing protein [Cryomorpha ignava]|uniref:T9SS type A sorting domain-containing protein n=1 Tax=Cryomorpha ignava TaxID=101383 RepID=A0A7K3WSG4_9FLAO|nr:zinc-dependent metalloprotease family protein [Cryomorpha ignava]NEN24633.1 T9SS type A sorting domain-containing protein [Cryomorpha ignava]
MTNLKLNPFRTSVLVTFLLACFLNFSAAAQENWNSVSLNHLKSNHSDKPLIESREAEYFTIDFQAIYEEILQLKTDYTIELPAENGKFSTFFLVENTTMSTALQTEFPEIVTYNIVSTQNHSTWGKLDLSPKGLHAMYKVPGEETIFIDPAFEGDTEAYIVYTRSKYIANKTADCLVNGGDGEYVPEESKLAIPYNNCELKTYRLAIAATGEYTQFQGGTVPNALSAIITTVNRVNMVYERDFGVTLELIANTTSLIYTSASTDPYSNGNPGAMINQNQTNINDVIGSENYDIGHVFGTNSGGLAGLGVVCGLQKARGVTGSGAPIGDSFDIDYVAHEMGHQFGGSHTFNNSCNGNRNNSTAIEPGSGSTIMAYAGICSPDVQNNSDDYFHGVSMRQIGIEIESHGCAVITSIDNTAPEIESVPTNVFIPISTPFALTAQASDMDESDILTYCWEQTDSQISTQPPSAGSTNGPNFRSFDPDLSPTRYFPRLPSLANSASQIWERLPAVGRNMNFRVTVRDNSPSAGCTQFENTTVTVVADAGPFTVTYPTTSGIAWDAYTLETVTWDVANTDQLPIDCQIVDIYLSVDGGTSYPVLLAENVANSGSAEVSVPNSATSTARVMVMNDAGTFFDISNSNFTINAITEGFYLTSDTSSQIVCIGDNVVFNITAEAVGNFDDPVTLSLQNDPIGITTTFGTTTLLPGQSTTLTLSNTSGVESGVVNLVVLGTSMGTQVGLPLQVGFNAVDASIPELNSPENNAEFVSTDVEFSWSSSSSPNLVFQFQLALDAGFTDIVNDIENLSESVLFLAGLEAETTYYWRVRKSTPCGVSDYSNVFSFSTHSCFGFESNDVPQAIPATAGVIASDLEVESSGIITDVNITNIAGTHFRVSDLVFKLKSPQGTEVTLVSNVCGSDTDFNFGFDDAAFSEDVDCPPTSGQSYLPEQALSDFNGEDSQGIWQLKVFDQVNGAGGSLTNWSIELCFAEGGSYLLTTNETFLNVCENNETAFGVTALPVFEFSDLIELSVSNLPNGVSATFNPETISPGQSSTVTLTASGASSVGAYDIVVNGLSGNIASNLDMNLNINEETPAAAELLLPQNLNSEVATSVTFVWEQSISPAAVYALDIAFDAAFSDMLESFEGLTNVNYFYQDLPPVETLFWRVRTDNECGEATSAVYSFSTLPCLINLAIDLPVSISALPTVYSSEIEVPLSGNVETVRVSGLSGAHFRVSDLSARLISPAGTVVDLFANVCGSDQDFNLSFSDDGLAEIDCPPTSGLAYAPLESLSAFADEEASGIWTLELEDSELSGGGSFEAWSLEICFDENVFVGVDNADQYNLSIFPNPASDNVKIGLGSASGIDLISLYDVSGRELKAIPVANAEWLEIDLSKYASGIYFIRATGDKGSSSFKLIKEN